MSDEPVYEFSGPHGASEGWVRSWPLDVIKDRLASGEDRVRFGDTIWRIRPDGSEPTPPSSTEGADPWAALKALPEWQTFARTWGEARPRTVCTFCEGSGEVEDEGWSPEFYPQERRYRDGIIDCGWCEGDGWRYVDRDDAADALVAAVEGGKGA